MGELHQLIYTVPIWVKEDHVSVGISALVKQRTIMANHTVFFAFIHDKQYSVRVLLVYDVC